MIKIFSQKRFIQAFCSALVIGVAGCAQPVKQTAVSTATEHSARPPVILVSIDGFKPDYLQRGVTPNLNALIADGVRAEKMLPSFPSITFPNHYTLVTGLRPDRHGMVGNTMIDPAIPGVRFSLGNRDAVIDRRWWDQAEPVWVTAEKNGVRTATMFWPGSEADIHGVRPTEWRVFDGKLPPEKRIDTLLGWFDQPVAKRAGFLTLYFDDVDHAGHEFGPDDQHTTDAVASVDVAIGRLIAGLRSRQMNANIVVVSDHGMAATSAERVVYLNKILPSDSFKVVTAGTYAGIEVAPGKETFVKQKLLKKHEHMECWNKADIPARYHFGSNARVPSVVCLADVGWLIFAEENIKNRTNGGAHGYDNTAPEMAATFIASGPAFKKNVVIPAFDNVDVYPLLMKLIGVPALPSDGSEKATAAALN